MGVPKKNGGRKGTKKSAFFFWALSKKRATPTFWNRFLGAVTTRSTLKKKEHSGEPSPNRRIIQILSPEENNESGTKRTEVTANSSNVQPRKLTHLGVHAGIDD